MIVILGVIITLIAIAAVARSPLLQWREPVYIIAGFAGVLAMVLLLFQPLLACGFIPVFNLPSARRLHRFVGTTLLLAVIAHVVGLWITSPPDVIDALLFVSATPFSIWGVIAMWAVFTTACLALLRLRLRALRSRPQIWKIGHRVLAIVIGAGSVTHALMIQGTMEVISKTLLCALVVIATCGAVFIPIKRISTKSSPNQRSR